MIDCRLVAAVAALSFAASGADAQVRTRAQQTQDRQIAQIPRCERPIGSITIADGDTDAYEAMELQPPQTLLRVVIQRSGCFTLVDRGNAARTAIERERQLANTGALQRGSNLGAGQTRVADFVLVAEVASQNDNAGGTGAQAHARSGGNGGGRMGSLGGALGGAARLGVAGATGGLLGAGGLSLGGGAKSQTAEANTVISIINMRTTETLAVAQGYAAKRDINWNLNGSAAFGGFVGGGYENTEFGRILGQAFIDAYAQSVSQLQGMGDALAAELALAAEEALPPAPPAAGPGPRRAAASRSAPTEMRVTQSATLRDGPGGSIVRVIRSGQTVFPTGEEDGDWVEVIDENDDNGWVQIDRLDVVK